MTPTDHDASLILRLSREVESLRTQLAAREAELAAINDSLDSIGIEWHDPMASMPPSVVEKVAMTVRLVKAFPLKLTDTVHTLPPRSLWKVIYPSIVGPIEDYVIAPFQTSVEAWLKAQEVLKGKPQEGYEPVITNVPYEGSIYWITDEADRSH